MTREEETNEVFEQESPVRSWSLWFIGGLGVSFLALCSLVLVALLFVSAFANAYLAWELAGFEVVVKVPAATSAQADQEAAGRSIARVTVVPEVPPTDVSSAASMPTPTATITRIDTGVSEAAPTNTPVRVAARDVEGASGGSEVAEMPSTTTPSSSTAQKIAEPSSDVVEISDDSAAQPAGTPAPAEAQKTTLSDADKPKTLADSTTSKPKITPTSTNTYSLIPLEGERDSRPAPEHADLSLNLREPESVDLPLELMDMAGATDPHAPNLTEIFEPNIIGAYTIHDWNWEANRKGGLLDNAVLIEVATTPGEPIYIPRKNQDIYQNKYYATVLYATEDSLTFVYLRQGTVANGYAVQYKGLQTDPNLLALYRESKGNQLPGLTLDTPVGTATDKLIIAMRDRGKFMDTRSRKDWWK